MLKKLFNKVKKYFIRKNPNKIYYDSLQEKFYELTKYRAVYISEMRRLENEIGMESVVESYKQFDVVVVGALREINNTLYRYRKLSCNHKHTLDNIDTNIKNIRESLDIINNL